MRLKNCINVFVLTATVITSAFPLTIDGFQLSAHDKEYISNFLQNKFSYDDLVAFVESLEKGEDLEDKYTYEELTEIKEFLSYVAHLGALNQEDIDDLNLQQKIFELLTPEEDDDEYQSSTSTMPDWYYEVFFPNQLPKCQVIQCKSFIKRSGYYIKKYAKKGYKETKKGCKKAYKKIAGKSKKGWKKTKKFIVENKKAIIIGLIVVTIVTLAIVFAPEIASLIALLVPANNQDPNNQTQDNPIASTYTENDYVDDCIEIVQEKLLASGISEINDVNSQDSSTLAFIKGIGSSIGHQLIDELDSAVQDVYNFQEFYNNQCENFKDLLRAPIPSDKLEAMDNAYQTLKDKFSSYTIPLEPSDGSYVQKGLNSLHKKTDEIFNTQLAAIYTPEAKAYKEQLGIKIQEAYIPLPGKPLLKDLPTKNVLKKIYKKQLS